MEDSRNNYVKVVSLHMTVNKEVKLQETNVSNQYIAADIFQKEIGDKDREFFALLCLNAKGNPTYFTVSHVGTLNQTLIHPREIFKLAIISNATSIIVSHNHPSGMLTPSPQDIENTKILIAAGEIVGITVIDHLIVSSEKSLSIRSTMPQIFKEVT